MKPFTFHENKYKIILLELFIIKQRFNIIFS